MLSVRETPTTLSEMKIRDSYSSDFLDDVRLPVAYVPSDDIRTLLAYVHFDDVHLPVLYVSSATYAFSTRTSSGVVRDSVTHVFS